MTHYVGVISIVNFQAKRLGLKGYAKDRLPRFAKVWREGWPTVLPLIALIYVLFSGYTPYMAAFSGITLCVIVGFTSLRKPLTLIVPAAALAFVAQNASAGVFAPALAVALTACIVIGVLNPRARQDFRELLSSMRLGVQYALAVGAAGAAGYFLAPKGALWRLVAVVAGVLLVAPSLTSDFLGLAVATPLLVLQIIAVGGERPAGGAAG